MLKTLGTPLDLQWELTQPFWRDISNNHITHNPCCELCGWSDARYMRVVTKSNSYTENSDDLETRCLFCFHEHRLSLCPSGTIIYCPEISQSQLNWFIHTQWALSFNLDGDGDYSQSIYSKTQMRVELGWLEKRREIVESLFGEGLSVARNFAECMSITQSDVLSKGSNLLNQLRLLPNKDGYLNELNYWGKEIYSQVMPNNHALANDIAHKLATLSILK